MSSAPILKVRERGPHPRWCESVDATEHGVCFGAHAEECINGNLMVGSRRTAVIQRLHGLDRR